MTQPQDPAKPPSEPAVSPQEAAPQSQPRQPAQATPYQSTPQQYTPHGYQQPYPPQPYAPAQAGPYAHSYPGPGYAPPAYPQAPYPAGAYYQPAGYQPAYSYFNPRLWQPIPGYGTPIQIGWQGKTWGLLGLGLANFALMLVTLLFYRFWATTEIRSRIWSGMRFNGEPLAYRGTGWELFLGFIIVFLIVIVPVGLISVGATLLFGPIVANVFTFLVIYPVLIYLIGVGSYRAVRYRLRRTSWRGVRGLLTGSGWKYGWIYLGSTLLMYTLIAFGGMFGMWIMPVRSIWLRKPIVHEATFGGQPLRFFPDTGELYKHFAIAWCASFGGVIVAIILMIVVAGASALMDAMPGLGSGSSKVSVLQGVLIGLIGLGWVILSFLMYFYYQARKANVMAAATFFEGGRFRGTATMGGLMWLWFSNLILWLANLICFGFPVGIGIYLYSGASAQTMRALESNQSLQATIVFGLLFFISIVSQVVRPIIEARSWRYYIDHLAFDGGVDLNRLQVTPEGADSKTGEGLAQAFDVDAF